jgi:integrase
MDPKTLIFRDKYQYYVNNEDGTFATFPLVDMFDINNKIVKRYTILQTTLKDPRPISIVDNGPRINTKYNEQYQMIWSYNDSISLMTLYPAMGYEFDKYSFYNPRKYLKDAIREATMAKYRMTQKWVEKLAPELKVCELTRTAYQKILNDYAKEHERQTTLDFHHQLKGAVMDAVDEGLIERDPTRKAIIKGKTPREKKIKYLNQFELHTLIADLDIKEEPNWDWFILLVAKTGMRFSEALAITPKDFDFGRQTLSISKTWDYKGKGGFLPTKNKSSVRKIQIDWQIVVKFSELIKGLPEDEPIFVGEEKIYNSTVNDALTRHCKACGISEISIHGLRHTHASLLLFAGVSIASVARRLGHASMTTTQKTYLHIIQELENKDVDLVMRTLSGL